MSKAHWLNIIYKGLMLLAAPSALWVALEMYGLTLFGSQMLFYSLTHAMPILLKVVMFSVIFFLIILAANITIIIFENLRSKIAVPKKVILFVLVFQLFHITALFTYEFWAHITILRILTAMLGLAFVFFIITIAGKNIFAPNKAIKMDV